MSEALKKQEVEAESSSGGNRQIELRPTKRLTKRIDLPVSVCYIMTNAMSVTFEIIGEIQDIETIAIGSNIRVLPFIQKVYGQGRWRKLKGIANVRLPNGRVHRVELHWYEAHGIGRKDMKIKRYLD